MLLYAGFRILKLGMNILDFYVIECPHSLSTMTQFFGKCFTIELVIHCVNDALRAVVRKARETSFLIFLFSPCCHMSVW